MLLDPNTLSADGTVALTGTSVSDDGKLLAYGLAAAGSDWQAWQVRDVATGTRPRRPAQVDQVLGRLVDQGRQGLLLQPLPRARSPATTSRASTTTRSSTTTSSARRSPTTSSSTSGPTSTEWQFHGDRHRRRPVPDHHRRQGDRRQVPASSTRTSTTPGRGRRRPDRQLRRTSTTFIDNDGPVFCFKTDHDAPRGRVIAIDTRKPEPERLEGDHPRGGGDARRRRASSATSSSPRYLKDAHTQVKRLRPRRHARPRRRAARASARRPASAASGRTRETFYSFTSASPRRRRSTATTSPPARARLPHSRRSTFDPADYETTQVFYTSKDGTQVPMFLSHKKGLEARRHEPRRCSTATAASTSR